MSVQASLRSATNSGLDGIRMARERYRNAVESLRADTPRDTASISDEALSLHADMRAARRSAVANAAVIAVVDKMMEEVLEIGDGRRIAALTEEERQRELDRGNYRRATFMKLVSSEFSPPSRHQATAT